MASGPISRPLAPSTRIFTAPTDSTSVTARRSPASVVTSQATASATRNSSTASPASDHLTHLCMAALELRREVDVEARAAARVRDRLRDVDADAQERQPVTQADAGRVLERVPEIVEGIAGVHEHGSDQVLRKVPLQLESPRQQVAAADLVAVGVDRRQLLVAVAAHALVAAGEEAVLRRQLLEIADDAGADLGAHVDLPVVVQLEAAIVGDVDAREVRVGAELARRRQHLGPEAGRQRIGAEEVG